MRFNVPRGRCPLAYHQLYPMSPVLHCRLIPSLFVLCNSIPLKLTCYFILGLLCLHPASIIHCQSRHEDCMDAERQLAKLPQKIIFLPLNCRFPYFPTNLHALQEANFRCKSAFPLKSRTSYSKKTYKVAIFSWNIDKQCLLHRKWSC